jgi:hypothetical protein
LSTTTRTPGIAADLPVPDRTTRIGRPTAEMEAKLNRTAGIMAVVFAIAAALAYWRGHSIWACILGGLAVVLFISIFSKKTDVGQCPYCMGNFTATPMLVKSGLSRCEKCGEYSQIANNVVKPMDPATYSESPKFESALFKEGSMPNACAACGAPATRLDTVTSSTMNKTLAAAVLVGSKRFAPSPWGPRPSMKADISTLHKPDILTLRRHPEFRSLTCL